MKSITSELYNLLANEATITAICAADNIMAAPADLSVADLPALVFSETERDTDMLLTGQPSGMVKSQVLIQAAGKSPEQALDLAEAVNDFLNGYTGAIGASLTCLMCYNSGGSDGFDDASVAHIKALNYSITHKETPA